MLNLSDNTSGNDVNGNGGERLGKAPKCRRVGFVPDVTVFKPAGAALGVGRRGADCRGA